MQWDLIGNSLGDLPKRSRSLLGSCREITGRRPDDLSQECWRLPDWRKLGLSLSLWGSRRGNRPSPSRKGQRLRPARKELVPTETPPAGIGNACRGGACLQGRRLWALSLQELLPESSGARLPNGAPAPVVGAAANGAQS
ncbi:hypothetical protein GW17_00015872 [Ensete ventricosum]|nr:hypothetical protein GW17_00015872 [Ensete ventricosum]